MRVYVQTADRAAIPMLPFYEVYEAPMLAEPEALTAFHQRCKEDFPKAKRILILVPTK